MAKKFTIKAPTRPEDTAPENSAQPIYELSTMNLNTAPSSITLPNEADSLPEDLRELAIRFIGARRRVGEALLEACRWMSEARVAAEEGQWYTFLQITETSPDSAEVLLNIHLRASQYPAFAEKIRSGWLSQTVAGELAKPSTPPELFAQLIESPQPLRVADVKRARRMISASREISHIVDNPDYSGSLGSASPKLVESSGHKNSIEVLLEDLASQIETLAEKSNSIPFSVVSSRALDRIEQALKIIRYAQGRGSHDGFSFGVDTYDLTGRE
jgi:hypothetical protein